AVAAPAGEAPDEHAGVQEVGLHADAIAQYGAAAEGAGRVDGDDADAMARRPQPRRDAVAERRLSGSRRPGDPDHVRAPGVRVEPAHEPRQAGSPVLDQRRQAREGDAVPPEHAVDELLLTHP